MSDNMERDKSERLNARKIEEEEMKRELTGIGIYEPGFTYNQMKEILGFLNESKDTSNVIFDNRNMQKEYSDNECMSETRSDTNATQELSRPLHAYKMNHVSPTAHSEGKTVRYSSSPESSPLYEMRNPMYRYKSSDSDEFTDKQYENTNSTMHNTNRFYSVRSGNSLQTASFEKKKNQDTQDEVIEKLERWQLNPLDIVINENDVPLRQPCRPIARERAPFECCKKANTLEQCDQIARILSQHLKEIAKLRYTWHPPANSVFQWGLPIQISTANGSLERKTLTDSNTEQIKTECTYKDNHERISKRKSNSFITNLNKESSSEDEYDNQYDFVHIKKRKVQPNSKSNNVDYHTTYQHINEKMISNVIAHQEHSFNDNNNDINLENEHIESLHVKRKFEEENERLSPELTTYPRKIVPPTPRARLSSSKQRKGNVISKPSLKLRCIDGSKDVDQAKYQKKTNTMTDNEIYRAFEEDWNSEQEEETVVTKNLQIQSSIMKEMRPRTYKKRLFNNTRTTRETKTMMKEGENKRERDKEIKRVRIHKEEKKEEELSRIDNRNGSWEHQLLFEDESSEMNEEFDVENSEQSANVFVFSGSIRCPICNKLFSHNEIEDHAADCEQFESNDEKEDNNINQFECSICNNYKTSNGMNYEQHVHQCIHNRNDEKHSHESKTVNIESASTSSFRHYKPISEQKDSEIDYLGQFPSNSKTKIYNTGKKRKR